MRQLRHLKKLNYANVVATLGLLIALGGTSYAAVKIDGSNVRDASLTGRDVRNGSLTGRDVRDRSIGRRDLKVKLTGMPGRRGAAGPAGNPGPRGIPGPRGAVGQRGPSLGVFARSSTRTDVPADTGTIESVSLDKGHWILSGSGFIRNDGPTDSSGLCSLMTVDPEKPGFVDLLAQTGDMRLLTDPSINHRAEQFSMDAVLTIDSRTEVHLACAAKPSSSILVGNTIITAIQTGELTDQSPS